MWSQLIAKVYVLIILENVWPLLLFSGHIQTWSSTLSVDDAEGFGSACSSMQGRFLLTSNATRNGCRGIADEEHCHIPHNDDTLHCLA